LKKGLGPLAIGLIAVLGVVVVGGVLLTNFVFRLEFIARTAREASIIEKINEVEFVKRALDKALFYSFHQASYFTVARGGYSNFDNVPPIGDVNGDSIVNSIDFNLCNQTMWEDWPPCDLDSDGMVSIADLIILGTKYGHTRKSIPSYNCIPYWRNYTTLNYPNFMRSIEEVSLNNLNDYVENISNNIFVLEYDKVRGIIVDDDYFIIKAIASEELNLLEETLHIKDNATINKSIQTGIGKLFRIGKENFIIEDKIGDVATDVVNLHDCDDSRSGVTSSINSKVSNLQTTLNNQYSADNIEFILSADSIKFDPSCNSMVAVRVLIKMKDTINEYLVYDDAVKTTNLRNIQLKFYILSGNYVIQPITNECGAPLPIDGGGLCDVGTCMPASTCYNLGTCDYSDPDCSSQGLCCCIY